MRKLIYIMGCANCGSTLLTTLLGRHSQIATVGELKMTAIPDVNDYLCGCGEQLLECGFWKKVRQQCQARGTDLDLTDFGTHYRARGAVSDRAIRSALRGPILESVRSVALAAWPPARRAVKRVTDKNAAVIDAVCEVENKPVFLDGSKDPVRLMHLIRSGKFNVRAIHLVRDGRAIVASYKKRNPEINYNLMLWRHKAEECERLREMFKHERILTLRYEDLCGDVAGTLGKVFEFSGLPREEDRCLDSDKRAPSHIIGHASRLENAREITLREEWKSILSANEIRSFEAADPGLNEIYEYDK